jgi:ribosomal protein S18 acetylase RimI-like enzyme
MIINYKLETELLKISDLREILDLYETLFDSSLPTNGFLYEIENQKKILFNLAYSDNSELLGFKVGFEKKYRIFYSWLGGVKKKYRGQGIAKRLMQDQHNWLKENEYQSITTHTSNDFKEMLILNLKNGFDITGTNINSRGEQRLILSKRL